MLNDLKEIYAVYGILPILVLGLIVAAIGMSALSMYFKARSEELKEEPVERRR